MIPSSPTQLVAALVLVVPGFVYQGVRIAIRGRLPSDVVLTTRIVRAIATSALFGLVYVMILGGAAIDAADGKGTLVDHPRAGALVAAVAAFIVPATAAVIPRLISQPKWWSDLMDHKRVKKVRGAVPAVLRYDTTPTAWDKAFGDLAPCFVRVLTADGRWMAGYFGLNSYATSYPEPRQLFLELCYGISDDGTIGEPIDGTLGVVVDCQDAPLVELIATTAETGETEGAESTTEAVADTGTPQVDPDGEPDQPLRGRTS